MFASILPFLPTQEFSVLSPPDLQKLRRKKSSKNVAYIKSSTKKKYKKLHEENLMKILCYFSWAWHFFAQNVLRFRYVDHMKFRFQDNFPQLKVALKVRNFVFYKNWSKKSYPLLNTATFSILNWIEIENILKQK